MTRPRKQTFADFCQTDAVNQLGLDPDAVARIRRAMFRPEMSGISSLEGLVASLKFLRRPFYHDDDLAWRRFLLTARYLWLVFKGKVLPRPSAVITADDTGTDNNNITTIADAIIARSRGRRVP